MKPYPALLAELLSKELYSLRQQKSLTQEAMAEQLRISTLLFLFSMLEADAQRVLIQQFMKQVQALEGTDAA